MPVTVTDAGHRGYMFMADELPIAELIALVGRTSRSAHSKVRG